MFPGNDNIADVMGTKTVSISGASAQSTSVSTDVVTVWATSDFWVARGPNPTAAAAPGSGYGANIPWLAGVPIELVMVPGDKLAFIGTSGTAYILERGK